MKKRILNCLYEWLLAFIPGLFIGGMFFWWLAFGY